MRWICVFAGLGLWRNAMAHPFSTNEYSLRTAVKISDKGVTPLVALEIPIPIALNEIGAKKEDEKQLKLEKIARYNEKQWKHLADNLTFTIDDKPMRGEWKPIKHPANGKAAEGFFVYLVSFKPSTGLFSKNPTLKSGSRIVIHNSAYPDAPMVYTGSARASEPWRIQSSTAQILLGENADLELSKPERWIRDLGLRTMTIDIE